MAAVTIVRRREQRRAHPSPAGGASPSDPCLAYAGGLERTEAHRRRLPGAHPMPTTPPSTLQTLNTAVLSDTLDSLHLMQQAMKPFMRPLDDTLQLFGRARTGVYMPVYAP